MCNFARVVEIKLDKYILENGNNRFIAGVRGNVKKKSRILVGDIVEYENVLENVLITKVCDRKNSLIRPPVANIDTLVIVVSINEPKPDYLLLDKQLILCYLNNIEPIICINKIDLKNDEEKDYIENVYAKLDIPVIFTSTNLNIGIEKLKESITGKVAAFSGNSGVGKSSITRRIIKEEKIVVGDVGEKTKRGKHTTKHVKLYSVENDTFILDTPGFSSYELYDVDYKDIKKCYTEFTKLRCDFDDCNHVNESQNVCSVKKCVANGSIDKKRYERYVYIFEKLKDQYDRKYK